MSNDNDRTRENSPSTQTTKDLLAKISMERQNEPLVPSTCPKYDQKDSGADDHGAGNDTVTKVSTSSASISQSETKKVRSFSSYMSNVEQRKLELAQQERKKKREEDLESQRRKEEEEDMILKRNQEKELKEQREREEKNKKEEEEKEKQRVKLEQLEMEKQELIKAAHRQEHLRQIELRNQPVERKEQEETVAEKPLLETEEQEKVEKLLQKEEDETDVNKDVGMKDAVMKDAEMRDSDSEPLNAELLKEEPNSPQVQTHGSANNSPSSPISSELSMIPSSLLNERLNTNSNNIDVPPVIPEVENSDIEKFEQDVVGSAQKSPRDDDSDAETVHDDSPVKPRRGRLVRKSELDSNVSSVKRVEFEDSDKEFDYDEYDDDNDDDNDNDNDNDDDDDDGNSDGPDDDLPRRKNFHNRSRSRSRSASLNTKVAHSKRRNGKDSSGRSKLQKACEKGRYEEAKRLIEEGADIDDADYAGNTPLLEAALNGHTKCVELLLENGADVDLQSGPDDLDTALIDSVANGHYDTVKVLLEYGADPRIENASGENALDVLDMDAEESETVKRLLREATMKLQAKAKEEKQAQTINTSDYRSNDERNESKTVNKTSQRRKHTMLFPDLTSKSGRNEIYERASEGDIEFVGTYLSNGGKSDPEALALAARYGHTDVVNFFLGFGAKVDSPTKKGLTPLMTTVGRGHLETVKLLVQAGADPTKKSKEGKNALDYALSSLIVDDDEIKFLKESAEKIGKKLEASQKVVTFTGNELKVRKRKASSTTEHGFRPADIKKKRLSKGDIELRDDDKKEKPKQEHIEKKLEQKDSKPKEHKELKEKPKVEINKEENKPEVAKRVLSNGSNTPSIISQRKTSAPVVPPPETEAEKQARLLKEKEEQRLREEYEAKRLAKQKAREQRFLSNFETEEKRKEEELKKLEQLEKERELARQKEAEERLKLETERKIMMSQQEERERRLKLRESYPYGLKIATFDNNRTGDDILQYLPLYYTKIDGVTYAIDIQVILILGLETFKTKYKDQLYTSQLMLSLLDKKKIFNFLYPFLGNFNSKSTTSQIEDFKEEFEKFKNLEISWIRFDTLMDIIKTDYPKLHIIIQVHTQFLEYESLVANPTFDTTFIKPDTQRKVSASTKSSSIEQSTKDQEIKDIEEFAKTLPWPMRVNIGLVKGLFRSRKKLW